MKISNTIKVNILVLFIGVLFIEIFFGHWFSSHSFGPYMREHRMKKTSQIIKFDNKEYKFIYERNYNGFRHKKINPSEIQAVIMGGSATEEKYKPIELTITGLLNTYLKSTNFNFEIINASIWGQSTFGHISNFTTWFNKLKNFKPKLYIFHIGIGDSFVGDRKIEKKIGKDGDVKNPDKVEMIFDYLKNNSFFYDKARLLKQKYYLSENKVIQDMNFFRNFDRNNYSYINYNKALKIHNIDKLKKKYKVEIKNYLYRVDVLVSLVEKNDGHPIFINQVKFDGLKDEVLFILNYSLIEHCKINKINCIDSAKLINGKFEFWYDTTHSTILGSEVIAKSIINELINILRNNKILN